MKNIRIDLLTKNQYVIGNICGLFGWGHRAVRIPSVHEKLVDAFCKFNSWLNFLRFNHNSREL